MRRVETTIKLNGKEYTIQIREMSVRDLIKFLKIAKSVNNNPEKFEDVLKFLYDNVLENFPLTYDELLSAPISEVNELITKIISSQSIDKETYKKK